MADTKKTASRSSTKAKGFTAEEKSAMRDRARELKEQNRKGAGEKALRDAIAAMDGTDREIAEKVHAIVTTNAPDLEQKTWYGMPAYAKNDKIVCFFQPAAKFKARYATFGFDENANIDEGTMWPTSWALTKLTAADEARLAALVKKAVS